MSDAVLEIALRYDRRIIAAALTAVVALAWGYVVWLATAVEPMAAMMAAATREWSPADFAFMATMWGVMMVGMMTPSAAPMVLLYARVGRQAAGQGKPFAAAGWFAAGYLLAWLGFSLAATFAQGLLERLLLLDAMLTINNRLFGGAVLIAAGLYQWSPLKQACLAQCQAPLVFIQRHGGFRPDARGALRLGLRHGAYCIGCCWALMALLFVGGVMSLLWIAGITALVLIEKLIPAGRLLPRLSGAGLAAAGAWLLVAAAN